MHYERTTLVASMEEPHAILALDHINFLDYNRSELIGSSILLLVGPKSNRSLFHSFVTEALLGRSDRQQHILYDRSGTDHQLIVISEPHIRDGLLVGCKLVFQISDAITLWQVFDDVQGRQNPYCLVSAHSPYSIHMVNTEFTRRFGCLRVDALCKDFISFISEVEPHSLHEWVSLFLAANEGQIAKSRVCSCRSDATPDEEAVCLPVVEADSGRILHIFVLLLPCKQPEDTNSIVAGRDSQPWVGLQVRIHTHPTAPRFPLPASYPLASAPEMPPLAAIRPRRKFGCSENDAEPVFLSKEMLDGLRHMPLLKAAESIGVSATALKRACRRLGVHRWDHHRRPPGFVPRARHSAGGAAAAANGGPDGCPPAGSVDAENRPTAAARPLPGPAAAAASRDALATSAEGAAVAALGCLGFLVGCEPEPIWPPCGSRNGVGPREDRPADWRPAAQGLEAGRPRRPSAARCTDGAGLIWLGSFARPAAAPAAKGSEEPVEHDPVRAPAANADGCGGLHGCCGPERYRPHHCLDMDSEQTGSEAGDGRRRWFVGGSGACPDFDLADVSGLLAIEEAELAWPDCL